ncbi:MAG TPA: hypothetical protein VIW68_06050 [Candidatus Sulfotelmatobacter sp.]
MRQRAALLLQVRRALQLRVLRELGTQADPPWASERLLAAGEQAVCFRPAWVANAQSSACAESQENVNFYQLGETVSTEDGRVSAGQ